MYRRAENVAEAFLALLFIEDFSDSIRFFTKEKQIYGKEDR